MTEQKEQVTPLPPEAMGLVAQLVQKNYNDYAATAQQLIESLQLTLAERDIELALIRERIEELSGKQWAPSSNALLAAIFVTRSEIRACMTERAVTS